MRTYLVAYLSTAAVFFGLDYVWLSRVAIGFYRSEIGEILRDRPNMAAAGLFYLFYVVGIVYFAVLPGVQKGSLTTALVGGALLGLIAYGTYDMTNLATLKVWSLTMSLIDMAWGAVLTAVAAGAGFWAVSHFKI
ncbi:MAG: DUF2177 domain-containing protein [Shinella sp.]|nr:MAG: DUF2177 domain-containing protein [Shinella sp.]